MIKNVDFFAVGRYVTRIVLQKIVYNLSELRKEW